MEDSLSNYGIEGYNPDNTTLWQKVKCPRCTLERKKRSLRDLSVLVGAVRWICWHCGWNTRDEKKASRPMKIKTIEAPVYLPNAIVYEYMAKRGISKETVGDLKIGYANEYMPKSQSTVGTITFPYYFGEHLMNIKYRGIGEKEFKQAKGRMAMPFNINGVALEEECVIVEGEMDALSFHEAGIKNVISVPDGAPNPDDNGVGNLKFTFLDNSVNILKSIKKFYLAVDADPSGQKLKEELTRRLGVSKCYEIKMPGDCKDANEVLLQYGKDSLKELIKGAVPIPHDGITYAQDVVEKYMSLHEKGFENSGLNIGLGRNFDDLLKMFTKVVWAVTGIPGSGKSRLMDYIATLMAARHGWKTAMYSPENGAVELHMQTIARQLMGNAFLPEEITGFKQMTDSEANMAYEFMDEHFFFLQTETHELSTIDDILDRAAYLVETKGIKQLIIDPWNSIKHPNSASEHSYIGEALHRLKNFAKKFTKQLLEEMLLK